MRYLVFNLAFISASVFASTYIVGGSDVSADSKFSRPVIALLTEHKNELKVTCTGTLIANRVAVTAAHCIDSIVSNNIFVSRGENPLSNERIKITHLLYYKPQFWGTMDTFEDIAILILEKEFTAFEVAQLALPDSIKKDMPVVQIGYGLQTFEPSKDDYQYPHFGKLQMLNSISKVSGIFTQRIETTSPAQYGVMGGDSGGPLITSSDSGVYLHGVLSQGGPSIGDGINTQNAYYTAPYYFIAWINSALTEDIQIKVPFELKQQFPISHIKAIRSEYFPTFNRNQCKQFRSGWDIDKDQVCWPLTKESCEIFERNDVPGEVYWDESTKTCAIID